MLFCLLFFINLINFVISSKKSFICKTGVILNKIKLVKHLQNHNKTQFNKLLATLMICHKFSKKVFKITFFMFLSYFKKTVFTVYFIYIYIFLKFLPTEFSEYIKEHFLKV